MATYQKATNISVKVSMLVKMAKTIQYIIHLTWKWKKEEKIEYGSS